MLTYFASTSTGPLDLFGDLENIKEPIDVCRPCHLNRCLQCSLLDWRISRHGELELVAFENQQFIREVVFHWWQHLQTLLVVVDRYRKPGEWEQVFYILLFTVTFDPLIGSRLFYIIPKLPSRRD